MNRNFVFVLTIFVCLVVVAFGNHNEKISSKEVSMHDYGRYPTWFSLPNRKLYSELNTGLKPNSTVAKDGSGEFTTVTDAINSYSLKNNRDRFIIYVKAGIYNEYITIDKDKTNILLYGDGPTKTIITGNRSLNGGVNKTMNTATFTTLAKDFIAKSIAFQNTAGHEAGPSVALQVEGDRSAFFDCGIYGYQDTLYAHKQRQFYRNCEISGTIDFIFGHSTTLIQNSKIIVRKPSPGHSNVVVVDGTKQKNVLTGIIRQNCSIMADVELLHDRLTVKTYLARPWKPFSRPIFINNVIGDFIQPDGYSVWAPNETHTAHCYFAEFGNIGFGPGANAQARAKWSKGIISKDEAAKLTAENWLQASTWLPTTDIPFNRGFES